MRRLKKESRRRKWMTVVFMQVGLLSSEVSTGINQSLMFSLLSCVFFLKEAQFLRWAWPFPWMMRLWTEPTGLFLMESWLRKSVTESCSWQLYVFSLVQLVFSLKLSPSIFSFLSPSSLSGGSISWGWLPGTTVSTHTSWNTRRSDCSQGCKGGWKDDVQIPGLS